MDTIGGRIKYLREQKGWQQKDIAEMTGIPRATMNRIENNSSSVSHENLISIMKLFSVSADWLLTGDFDITSTKVDRYEQHPLQNANSEETRLIANYRQLDINNKDLIKGKVVELLREQSANNKKDTEFSSEMAT